MAFQVKQTVLIGRDMPVKSLILNDLLKLWIKPTRSDPRRIGSIVINHFASPRKGSFQASRNALGEQPNRLAKTVAKYWLEENPQSRVMSVMIRPGCVFNSCAA